MSGWLIDQVALVTGGASGIGLAVVERYLNEGARGVVVLDRDIAGLDPVIARFSGKVKAIAGDVRDYASHEAAVSACVEAYGRLDVMVGNAGVFDFRRPLRGYTAETLKQTMGELFDVNLLGYLYAAMASREALIESGGSMIFTASVASFHSGGGGVVYTMAKHAVLGMIRQLALELAPTVRVNGVGPGGTVTKLRGTSALGHAERAINANADELAQRIAQAVPLRLAQQPEDHTGLYVLLASRPNSRAITGEVMMSDGGVGIRSA
jgi:NAD(P)-dependent dehydrogenase (short-subunit alcohol dehydrogenase family)